MTSHIPVAGFDYTVTKPNSNWTQAYVRNAFPTASHPTTVKPLFARARALSVQHHLRKNAYPTKAALDAKRDEVALSLAQELGSQIEIQGFPDFPVALCRGVLLYQSGPGWTGKGTDKGCFGNFKHALLRPLKAANSMPL